MDKYDDYIYHQSIHNAPMREILRDISLDTNQMMTGWSADAIAKRESTVIRSRDRSIELGSLLTIFKLFDIITTLESSGDSSNPPLHKKMQADFSKFKVCLHVIKIF